MLKALLDYHCHCIWLWSLQKVQLLHNLREISQWWMVCNARIEGSRRLVLPITKWTEIWNRYNYQYFVLLDSCNTDRSFAVLLRFSFKSLSLILISFIGNSAICSKNSRRLSSTVICKSKQIMMTSYFYTTYWKNMDIFKNKSFHGSGCLTDEFFAYLLRSKVIEILSLSKIF